jgi:hypothetical protein
MHFTPPNGNFKFNFVNRRGYGKFLFFFALGPPPPPLACERKQIQFPKRCVFWFVEIRTMDEVQKPSSNECYTPSSEPFRKNTLYHMKKRKQGKLCKHCNKEITVI